MHIALLEDNQTLAEEVVTLLINEGHSVVPYSAGGSIMQGLRKDTFDLFVLDWNVPAPDGMSVLSHIRHNMKLTTPVIFLTSNHSEEQIVLALNAGADDYCIKPIRKNEFLARIAALQRRGSTVSQVRSDIEHHEGYVFNRAARTVLFEGELIQLSEKEFNLCILMFNNIERPMSRQRIMLEIWGREEDDLSRTLDVHISWIRRKLNIGAQGTRMRLTVVFGYGYRLVRLNDQAGIKT